MVHLSRIRHENDAQSVEEIVAELKQESYNPILCYKRQGILDPDIPQLPADGFVVAFQTKFQKDLYEMFASTIVCIDSTHKTNSHNFKLITVVVPDEYGEGQPVAWCIADREDTPLMSLFLGKLHERSPTAEVKTIMTDDDNAGWNAAQYVFGPDIKHLLCRWHIDKNWRQHLRSVKDSNHQVELYHTLNILLEEPDKDIYIHKSN